MEFKSYINQAWNDHATQSEKVVKTFSHGEKLIETNEQLSQLINLVTHIMGEHLALWNEGIKYLQNLQKHPVFIQDSETHKNINRSIAALQLASGSNLNLDKLNTSDSIRILALAASALSERDPSRGQNFLKQALDLAATDLDDKDPAHRSLAITGNNLACALEEKKSRSIQETELMILAAQTARKHWEIAGSWLEISRAEYRLAMTYLQATDLNEAMKHASTCLQICLDNKADNLDLFFAYEALAQVQKIQKNSHLIETIEKAQTYFKKLNANDQAWCEPSLKKLINL